MRYVVLLIMLLIAAPVLAQTPTPTRTVVGYTNYGNWFYDVNSISPTEAVRLYSSGLYTSQACDASFIGCTGITHKITGGDGYTSLRIIGDAYRVQFYAPAGGVVSICPDDQPCLARSFAASNSLQTFDYVLQQTVDKFRIITISSTESIYITRYRREEHVYIAPTPTQTNTPRPTFTPRPPSATPTPTVTLTPSATPLMVAVVSTFIYPGATPVSIRYANEITTGGAAYIIVQLATLLVTFGIIALLLIRPKKGKVKND